MPENNYVVYFLKTTEKVFYKDLEEADKQTKRFHEMLHNAKEILGKFKTVAVAASEAGFNVMTNS